MLSRLTRDMESRGVLPSAAPKMAEDRLPMSRTAGSSLSRTLRVISKCLYFVLGIALILCLTYMLGRALLVERIGNDGPHQLSYAVWLEPYFPDVPNWFPLAGGGYSVGRAYPVLPGLVIAAASHWTGMSPIEWFHIAGFVSIVLTAIGIYLFCWSALKNQSLGLIASCLYLLSPISWFFIYVHGFITTVMALAFVPFTLLAFERYFTNLLENSKVGVRRTWFLVSVFLLSLSLLMHVDTGSAAVAGMLMYAAFIVISQKAGHRLRAGRIAVMAILATGLAAGLLLAFWLLPINLYSRFLGGASQLAADPNVILQGVQSLEEMISLTPPETQYWERNASYPLGFVGLSLVGVFLSWVMCRKWFSASAIGLIAVLFSATTVILAAFTYIGPFSHAFGLRSLLLLATLFIPIGAAVGSWGIAKLMMFPFDRLGRAILSKKARLQESFGKLLPPFVSFVALLVAASIVFAFRNVSSADPQHLNYGIDRLEGVNLRDVWRTGEEQGSLVDQLRPKSWPKPSVAESDGGVDESLRVLYLLPNNRDVRIDVSPYLGRLAQNMVVYTGDSQLAVYTVSADLIQSMHFYYAGVFFGPGPERANSRSPAVLNELAKWLGTEYVYLNVGTDPTELYNEAGWELAAQDSYGGVPIEIRRFPSTPGLATLSSRPSILVMSNPELDAYTPVFHVAMQGAIPYEEAWFAEGNLPIDKYSLEELQRFDVLFLQGYRYDDSTRAWNLLEQYVRQGGALYVDTGWQWTVPDWESDPAPDVLPVSRLTWTSYGITNDYQLEMPEISGDTDLSQFASLEWDGKPWGVSGTSRAEVREWGQIVLSAAGYPLIVAGEYGDGRIIWSGMNLVSHAYDKENEEEVRFLYDLIAWLTAEKEAANYPITVAREHPDRVEFRANVPTSEKTMLYWREAYYPAWQAYLEAADGSRQRLPIHKGGPGFMLISVPPISGELNIMLEWETPLIEKFAAVLSVITLVVLFAVVADGVFWRGRYSSALGEGLKRRRRKDKPVGRVAWLESPNSDWAETSAPSSVIENRASEVRAPISHGTHEAQGR